MLTKEKALFFKASQKSSYDHKPLIPLLTLSGSGDFFFVQIPPAHREIFWTCAQNQATQMQPLPLRTQLVSPVSQSQPQRNLLHFAK